MKIIDILKDEKLSLSFEVFPPKTDTNFESVKDATEKIALQYGDRIKYFKKQNGGVSLRLRAVVYRFQVYIYQSEGLR